MSFRTLAQSLDPFIDPGGDTFIMIEIEGKAEPETIPLQSRQGQAVLRARLCDHLKKGYPTDHELRSATEVIYGYAFEKERKVATTSIEYLIATKPLAQAIIAIAETGGTQASPSKLLAKVNTIATRQAIDKTKGPWPHSEDSLGCLLSQLEALLRTAGIRLERGRGNERWWRVEPIQPQGVESDGEVSDANSRKSNSWKSIKMPQNQGRKRSCFSWFRQPSIPERRSRRQR